MSAIPIYAPVSGSPFQPDDIVRVVRSVDSVRSQCGVHAFIGLVGRVTYLEYFCGCGQRYPVDPMIGVKFDDGRVEEFWCEEIERLPS